MELLTQEQILAKIKADLNALVIELGYVDEDGNPLYYFHGEVSTYDNYDWIKAIEIYTQDEVLKYLPIIPFALIREDSVASAGETINERLDTYSFYSYIKTEQKDAVRFILETYMARENMDENLVEVDGSNVLKNFSNFNIDDEELIGAPDGSSRHQVHMAFTYDIYELGLISSKDYELLIDDRKVKYLSWRFEKANMVIANNENTDAGTRLLNVNKLHEVVLVCELFIETENPSSLKVREDIFSLNKTNTSYNIKLKCKDEYLFNQDVVFNGGKTVDTPPQVNTMEVTFALSYQRIKLEVGLFNNVDAQGNQIFENIPVYKYKFGHASALHTATYLGDNAAKSRIIGLAKGLAVIIPVLMNNSAVMVDIIGEVLGKVYTNKYAVRITFLGVVRTYEWVISESSIESEDAAYDSIAVTFSEAK